uniref:TYR_PHOSPHATASE_2 domain-containing protein n=1 Tax=Heterorhabditis bacteriophora TaxID=37862 RepID=A0A1I7XA94_HETBA
MFILLIFCNKVMNTLIFLKDLLSYQVTCEPSRKNLSIFEWSMASCELLSGQAVICCKSGKDRTGMAVTLEQGRVLRETCGLNAAQVLEVVNSLRRDGARRENCVKNVGKAMYSFSPFQMHFLPKIIISCFVQSFRPPNGTYAQGIAS